MFAIQHKVAEGESQTMTLVAENATTVNTWVDGLKSLLGESFFPSESFTVNFVISEQLQMYKLRLMWSIFFNFD